MPDAPADADLEKIDEAALVTRSRAGDRRAFEQLVRRVARLLFAHLYLKTRDAHRAQDLVQETLLLVWRRIGELHDASSFRPWLMVIANCVATDAARHATRKKRFAIRVADATKLEQVHDPAPPPDAKSATDEQRRRVLSVLESLPEEYRVPLSLRYLAGADYQTISKQLALTNGSLRGLLQRGMNLLREKMRGKDVNR